MANLSFCIVVLLSGAAARAQTQSTVDQWGAVRFLVGSWEGDVNGQPGRGRSLREYRFVLNNRYLEVRNKSIYPVQLKNPKGETHEDWGMISYDRMRKKLVLRQFHVEGFVNQYAADPGERRVLTFNTETIENVPTGFRARETYTITDPNAFVERFEIAEPGQDFEVYCETTFRRKR